MSLINDMLNDLEGDKNNKPQQNTIKKPADKKPTDGTSHALNNPKMEEEKEQALESVPELTIPPADQADEGLKLPPKDSDNPLDTSEADSTPPTTMPADEGHALNNPKDTMTFETEQPDIENPSVSPIENATAAKVAPNPWEAPSEPNNAPIDAAIPPAPATKPEEKPMPKPAPNPWDNPDKNKPAEQSSQTSAPQPQKNHKPPKQKRLIILLVILIIALIICGGYYFWPRAEVMLDKKFLAQTAAQSTPATPPAAASQATPPQAAAPEQIAITKDDGTTPATSTTGATTDTTADKSAATDTKDTADSETSITPAKEPKPEVDPFAQAKEEYSRVMSNLDNTSSLNVIKQLAIILQQTPNYNQARATLAALLIKYDQPIQALGVLKVGLLQDPANQEFAELAAHVLVQRKEIPHALAILKRAEPATTQANPSYMAFMAALYLQQKDYQSARTIYQSLVEYNSNQGNWWAGLGISLQKLGQNDDAYNAFNHAETLGGLSPTLESYVNQALQGSI